MTLKELQTAFKVGIVLALVIVTGNYLTAATWQAPTANPPNIGVPSFLTVGPSNETKAGSLRVRKLISDTAVFVPTVLVPQSLDSSVLLWVGGIVRADDFCAVIGSCLGTNALSTKKIVFSGGGSYNVVDDDNAARCFPTGNGLCSLLASASPRALALHSAIKAMQVKRLRVKITDTPTTGYCRYSVLRSETCNAAEYQTALECQVNTGTGNISCADSTNSITVDGNDCLTFQVQPGPSNSCTGSATWTFEGEYKNF